MQEEVEVEALRRLLDGALRVAAPQRPETLSGLSLIDTNADAANDPLFEVIRPLFNAKNGANLVKIAPFFIATVHFFLDDPGQWVAAWLLAFLANKRPSTW
ncbi:hypothetical protein VA599_11785 [Chromobacterium sp. TRC.1.1.SA]|uniref:Uncharacterized protein n=1 Tax=Chromobacterium indicum TaxID=3110228 RepID=A0ABV0CKK8_9NEIS